MSGLGARCQTRRRRAAAAATLALCSAVLLLPAAASADDASLFKAYQGKMEGHHRDLRDAVDHYERVVHRIEHKGWSRSRAQGIIKSDREINAALNALESDVAGEQPSSGDGADAKRAGLREIAFWRKANKQEIKAAKAIAHDRPDRGEDWYREANRTIKRAGKNAKRAHKAFVAAGFHPKHWSVGDV